MKEAAYRVASSTVVAILAYGVICAVELATIDRDWLWGPLHFDLTTPDGVVFTPLTVSLCGPLMAVLVMLAGSLLVGFVFRNRRDTIRLGLLNPGLIFATLLVLRLHPEGLEWQAPQLLMYWPMPVLLSYLLVRLGTGLFRKR